MNISYPETKGYQNIYSNKLEAINEGKKKIKELFQEECKESFTKLGCKKIPQLTDKQLFNLDIDYSFDITEFDPEDFNIKRCLISSSI